MDTSGIEGEAAGGEECVDWAASMLEQGYDSTSLRILAGLSPPLNHFEVAELRDRVLSEIRPPELEIEDSINVYVAEIAWERCVARNAGY